MAVEAAGGDLVRGDDVAHAAAADAVDGSVVLVENAVSLELLVEGEHGTLGGRLDVAAATATAEEDLAGGGRGKRSGVCGHSLELISIEPAVVSCAAASTVVDGVVVSEGVVVDLDGHGDGWLYLEEEVWFEKWKME